jgi:hypothetical protein
MQISTIGLDIAKTGCRGCFKFEHLNLRSSGTAVRTGPLRRRPLCS